MTRTNQLNARQNKAFWFAIMAESLCVCAGLAAFFITDKPIWAMIGVVAGLGFSMPAFVELFKASKEQTRA